jgi:hypothetical protein
MQNRKVRNLAVTAITVMSAIGFAALGTTSASASTNPTCVNGTYQGVKSPLTCVQVFGNGLVVDAWNGWAYNNTNYAWGPLHMELYYNRSTPAGPTGSGSIPEQNCGEFYLEYVYQNSNNCSWAGASNVKTVDPGYYCSALWLYLGNNQYADLSSKCVYVHS